MRGLAALAVVLHDSATERTKRLRWPWFAVVTAAPVLAMIVIAGSVWTLDHLFWVDMLLGFPAALLLAAAATGRPAPLVRTLNTRRIRSLVSFSYSLYLIHAPIVVVVYAKIVAPHVSAGTPAFLATAAIAGHSRLSRRGCSPRVRDPVPAPP
jgi:peptidoglycan/LPS O-acetylase OafA/YrhL